MEDMNRKLDRRGAGAAGTLGVRPTRDSLPARRDDPDGRGRLRRRTRRWCWSSTRGAPAGEVLRLILPEATLAHDEVAHAVDRLGQSSPMHSVRHARRRADRLCPRDRPGRLGRRRDVYELRSPASFTSSGGSLRHEVGRPEDGRPVHLRSWVRTSSRRRLSRHLAKSSRPRLAIATSRPRHGVAAQLLRASVPGDIPTLLERAEREAARLGTTAKVAVGLLAGLRRAGQRKRPRNAASASHRARRKGPSTTSSACSSTP